MNANLAIQILPKVQGDEEVCRVVDEVIAYIKSTGLHCFVGPCETAVEGDFDTIMEIAQELYTVEQQISKLEFYVSQLEEKQAEVIRKYYFEGKTWGELQREMHLAPRTLLKRRDDGLDALVSIYSYIGQVKGDRRNT